MKVSKEKATWIADARAFEIQIRNKRIKELMNGDDIARMKYLLRVAIDTLEEAIKNGGAECEKDHIS